MLFFEHTNPCLLRSSLNSPNLEKPRIQSAQKHLYNKEVLKHHTVSNAEWIFSELNPNLEQNYLFFHFTP